MKTLARRDGLCVSADIVGADIMSITPAIARRFVGDTLVTLAVTLPKRSIRKLTGDKALNLT